MIKKIHRLNEGEIRKVLKYKKPFFSYGLVANVSENRLNFSRFAIILGSKNTKGSVNRNFFRRKFYDLSSPYLETKHVDVVIVVKKGKTFDKKNEADIVSFENDIKFLYRNIFEKN